jgi:divalent metal cation (Fe/Co/Zn/Cd) transporter
MSQQTLSTTDIFPKRPKSRTAAMSSSETELRHAISMRPHPFHTHPHESRDHSPAIHSQTAHAPASPETSTSLFGKGYHGAHTTSYEATTPDEESSDPVARHGTFDHDVEGSPPQPYTPQDDPFNLSSKIKTPTEIDLIKANTSKKRNGASTVGCAVPLYHTGKGAWRAKKIQDFYEGQNENIERLLKPVDDHRREAKEVEGDTHLKYRIAVTGSFVANVILAGLQLYAAASSKSLSLFTTMADALFDPMSNIMLILTHRAVKKVDGRRYPSGKARLETAGNIFFCFIMTSVSLIIIVQSIIELAGGGPKNAEGHPVDTKDFNLPSVIVVGVAFCTKLALFMYCFALRDVYSQIRILWEDHRNDLLINGIGLAFSVMGSFVRWWIDPAGAILLSLTIVFLWQRTAYSEFQLLVGVTADTTTLQLITYICTSFDPQTPPPQNPFPTKK